MINITLTTGTDELRLALESGNRSYPVRLSVLNGDRREQAEIRISLTDARLLRDSLLMFIQQIEAK